MKTVFALLLSGLFAQASAQLNVSASGEALRNFGTFDDAFKPGAGVHVAVGRKDEQFLEAGVCLFADGTFSLRETLKGQGVADVWQNAAARTYARLVELGVRIVLTGPRKPVRLYGLGGLAGLDYGYELTRPTYDTLMYKLETPVSDRWQALLAYGGVGVEARLMRWLLLYGEVKARLPLTRPETHAGGDIDITSSMGLTVGLRLRLF